jgi:hypothetical protein
MHSTARVVRSDWQENPQIRGRWMVLDGGKRAGSPQPSSPEQTVQNGLQLVPKRVVSSPAAGTAQTYDYEIRSICSRLYAADRPMVTQPFWIKALWTAGVIVSGCALFWFSA